MCSWFMTTAMLVPAPQTYSDVVKHGSTHHPTSTTPPEILSSDKSPSNTPSIKHLMWQQLHHYLRFCSIKDSKLSCQFFQTHQYWRINLGTWWCCLYTEKSQGQWTHPSSFRIWALIVDADDIPHHLFFDFDVHVLDGPVSCYMQSIYHKLQASLKDGKIKMA